MDFDTTSEPSSQRTEAWSHWPIASQFHPVSVPYMQETGARNHGEEQIDSFGCLNSEVGLPIYRTRS